MEEFLNLNWSWKTARSANLYATNFSDDEKDIFFCHLNEIDHIHLLDNYGKDRPFTQTNVVQKDPRTGQEVTNEVIDHSRQSKTRIFSNFPRRSSMNSSQHQSCLNAVTKLNSSESALSMSDRSDIRTYAQLFIVRTKEKTEFLEFVKGEFIKKNIRNCQNLQPELNKFIIKRWEDSIKRVTSSNQNYYHLQSAIPLNHSHNSDEITIELEKTVEEIGNVLAINRSKYTNPLQVSCSFLEYFFQDDTKVITPEEERLISEPIDVSISLTSLASILSYSKDFSIDWSIAFSLKIHNNKKVLVFGEILPPPTLGCLERNRKAYKYGVIASIVVSKKKEIFSFKENGFVQREHPTLEETSTSILSVEPETTYKAWRFEEYLNKFTDSISKVNGAADSNLDHNHISRLWNMKKNGMDFCRLLINNSQDVCEKQIDGSVQFINLSPKIDYQCEFGAEQMTLSELITEWCELRFGPNTVTDRVRIDAARNCIFDAKQIKIADVEFDLQRLYQFKKDFILEQFYQYINIIKEFPPNDYMLRHQPKHNAQVMVYVKSNDIRSANAIKIADIYDSNRVDTSNLEIIPWNPIDDVVCTPVHKQSVIMPCAFPYWGKKAKKTISNDRTKIVQKALQKKQDKLDAISKKKALVKRNKINKNNKKRKCEYAKRVKLKFEGESLDPNELFDEQGNIHINSSEIISMHHKLNEVNNPTKVENDSSEIICYESYRRDAEVNSDDSVDSSYNNQNKQQ